MSTGFPGPRPTPPISCAPTLCAQANCAPASTAAPGPVLRLAVLIADAAGEILFWNAEAEEALRRLPGGRSVRLLQDLFAADAIAGFHQRKAWSVLSPMGAAGITWRVRGRSLVDSGRSLVLFLAGAAPIR